ncbi:MAG TPA: GPR1/FUN34/YaaH family transporter [Spirochaetia bacterium]|nr:GPR1/FUN34/YaaH family transporter [Spirochaetia bacterium]
MPQQQEWANQIPWAINAVAVLTASVGAVYAGWVPPTTIPLLIGILLACSLPQLLAGIIFFKRGELLLGTISGVFGTVITLGAAITLWQQVIQAPKPGAFTPEVMGVFWVTLFVITETYAVGFGRISWLLMAGIAEVGVAFLLLGVSILGGSANAGVIAGYLLLLFAAFCIYSSTAVLWAEHFERPILPLGRPVFK